MKVLLLELLMFEKFPERRRVGARVLHYKAGKSNERSLADPKWTITTISGK